MIRLVQAAALAAALIGAVDTPVIAAPDDTLGVAYMSAVVGSDGTFVANKSVGVTSSNKTADGTYIVQFRRDISNCAYVASLGDIGAALPPVGSALVSQSASDSSSVFVETVNSSGTLADASFHLFVFCAR